MTDVAFHRHSLSSIGSVSTTTMPPTAPDIEMVPNPTFSFPMRPQAPVSGSASGLAQSNRRRPTSMNFNVPAAQPGNGSHKRTASALPSFSFNAADASGLNEDAQPQQSPLPSPEPESVSHGTPRRGHTRYASTFVGGVGVSGAISSSPTKSDAPEMPQTASALATPAKPTRHAHKRSWAVSTHDASMMMLPSAEAAPRLSSSLPTTPMEQPPQSPPALNWTFPAAQSIVGSDAIIPADEDVQVRPPSRPRVGFSDNVEIIPRPLSTVSSETASSVRGHSVNNSINSMISLNTTPNLPSSRVHRRPLSVPSASAIGGQNYKPRSSIDGKVLEPEGEWLRPRGPSIDSKRQVSDSTVASSPSSSFISGESPFPPAEARQPSARHQKNSSFFRRRSEPNLSVSATSASATKLYKRSSTSLQESAAAGSSVGEREDAQLQSRSSTRKIKDWALSKMHRSSRDFTKTQFPSSPNSFPSVIEPPLAESADVPGKVPIIEPPVAETNLDAVFDLQATPENGPRLPTPQSQIEFNMPFADQHGNYHADESDDEYSHIDLDAAMGPMQTPDMGYVSNRKQLHSARLRRDFSGQGMHYHRRTESAPTLTAYTGPCQEPMQDVFEEDEEEDYSPIPSPATLPTTRLSGRREAAGTGISIVDSDQSALNFGADDGLGIRKGGWELERPSTSRGSVSYGSTSSRLSTPIFDRRPSSIIEETIVEETSPVDAPADPVEIVQEYEEPRTSSLTKSSDSSETPTLIASHTGTLTLPDRAASTMTPDTYQTSAFSSPDFGHRQGSFDNSRLGTSASSVGDNRTMSSCTTAEHVHDIRGSVDDVPSLTSSRSTMISTMQPNTSRRDISDQRTPSGGSSTMDPTVAAERRRKRASIQSLSQLMGGSFGPKPKPSGELRPQTARTASGASSTKEPKKEHMLKKLMFWKSKQSSRQSSISNKLQKDQPTAPS